MTDKKLWPAKTRAELKWLLGSQTPVRPPIERPHRAGWGGPFVRARCMASRLLRQLVLQDGIHFIGDSIKGAPRFVEMVEGQLRPRQVDAHPLALHLVVRDCQTLVPGRQPLLRARGRMK